MFVPSSVVDGDVVVVVFVVDVGNIIVVSTLLICKLLDSSFKSYEPPCTYSSADLIIYDAFSRLYISSTIDFLMISFTFFKFSCFIFFGSVFRLSNKYGC